MAGRNTHRIDHPFEDLSDKQVDGRADRLVEEYGLQVWRTTFVKAARVLRNPRTWRAVEQIDANGVAGLTPVERADLQREEQEAIDHVDSKAPWTLEFWRKHPAHLKKRADEPPRKSGFWHQPKELRTTIIILCIGAIVQGWNQTGSNGANLTWPVDLLNPTRSSCEAQGDQAWLFAIVNAAPWFSAAIFALLLSDPANELLFGRRAAIIISAVFILAASVGGALVKTWQQFLACRIILGIGMGCKASVVAVFAAEVAPARIRGSLVMNWQLFDAFGIFLGFSANLMVAPLGTTSWRWMTASSAFPTIILLALAVIACPESPRFLMGKGKDYYPEAYETLSRLRGSRVLAAKELLYTHYQQNVELIIARHVDSNDHDRPVDSDDERDDDVGRVDHIVARTQSPNLFQKFGQLFTIPRIRNATLTAVVAMVAQQLCGVNVLIFYSSTIFATTSGVLCEDVDSRDLVRPLMMSWGIGLVNFLFAFPAYWLIDQKGRRWLLTTTLPFLLGFMGAAALSYIGGSHDEALAVFSYIFIAIYSWGMGPVPFTISAEVFPLDHRVAGMSFAVFTNLLGAGLLTLFVPAITASSLSHGGLLGIFTFLNLVAFVLVFCFVRETVGAADRDNPGNMTALALEELYKIFEVPAKGFWQYQVLEVIPLWLSRLRWYLGGCRTAEPRRPEPLYRWWEVNDPREMQNIVQREEMSEREQPD
ncbi:Arabinose-proton symporter [Cercospora beticola]|uniref:Arabinose-proton symporter n=1 Tax=Cercospora beticola TaxID=122368 RepID=A0A2G5HD77_CERBT|nr:Arabinose-proton symporter [Cercospora beticola]PIA90500.1 Arabinose-proton symporter [Cercospora beticola]WPB07855.1 hypothetical protein RHO25_012519 [Cercospora beticola]CAK1368308.1 unnamed protein product [Cercospora beticola]